MSTQAISPADAAGAKLAKRENNFDNIVSKINQRLVDGTYGPDGTRDQNKAEFTFHSGTDYSLVSRVVDAFEAQGWHTELCGPLDDSGEPRYTLQVKSKPVEETADKATLPENGDELFRYFAEHYPWAKLDLTYATNSESRPASNDCHCAPERKCYKAHITGAPVHGVAGDGSGQSEEERVDINIAIAANDWPTLVSRCISAVDRCNAWVKSPLEVERGVFDAFEQGMHAMQRAIDRMEAFAGFPTVRSLVSHDTFRDQVRALWAPHAWPNTMLASLFHDKKK
ncbi:MAG: hypothetical protein JSS66_06380 [Armatimonadetes bacterium]|nr:hypothetical protein [Armatimonadota bacterium]